MSWPVLWGSPFWFLIHSAAWSHVAGPWDRGLEEDAGEFLRGLAAMLPCPSCRVHATAYLKAHEPVFHSGLEFWRFTVDFHNEVSGRVKKASMSYAAAESALLDRLRGLGFRSVHAAFAAEYFFVLFYCSYTYTPTPDKASDAEQMTLRRFLTAVCPMLPFRARSLRALVCGLNLESRESTFASMATLYNAAAVELGYVQRTVEEQRLGFLQQVSPQQYGPLVDANRKREEDHKRLCEQQTSHQCELHRYQIATAVLASLLGILVIAAATATFVVKKNSKKT